MIVIINPASLSGGNFGFRNSDSEFIVFECFKHADLLIQRFNDENRNITIGRR